MPQEPIRALIPLPDEKTGLLARLVDGLEPASLQWLSGYAAGLAARAQEPSWPRDVALRPITEAAAAPALTVVFGSQTGNARRVAEALVRDAEAAGVPVRLLRADAYPLRELRNERMLYLVISTQGDGEPPDDARALVEFLASKRAPRLDELKFAVLGLGDSSYAQFCAIGIRLDARLAELGGTRLLPRADADVDLDAVAKPWAARALSAAREAARAAAPLATVTPLRPQRSVPAWGRERPYAAEVLANQRISARGAIKDIRHIELSLRASGLSYEPGDSLGVWPTNPPRLVDAVIAALGAHPEAAITIDGDSRALRDWLLARRELTRLARPFVFAHAQRARADDLDALVASPAGFPELLADAQVIDLLRRFPAAWDPQEFVAALRPLTPRLYSIASSLKSVDDEAHLTVARVAYDAFGFAHTGAASEFLSTQAADARVPVFVEANERFRLPQDPARDVIMIGPGTGVAPFRAFLQERAAVGATGRNWLFFGNPHLRTDFLYQLEWQQALKRGELHRLDVAFSRDQADKVYVQQRIRRRARDLYAWLQDGAHVYVCGDALRMAKDVHAALRDVVASGGGMSSEDAEAFLAELAAERRYCRDVY